MPKLYFDFDLLIGPRYGIAYAVLEQMQALRNLGAAVENFALGWQGLNQHCREIEQAGFRVRKIHFPRQLHKLVPESLFLGKYDYFLQIGLHAFRSIPARKYILAVHDTVGLRYPDQEAGFPKYARELLNYAGKIITVSEFSKSELINFFQLPADKIEVVPNGCNFKRFNPQKDFMGFKMIRQKNNLPEKYFLTYGGPSPRKNIKKLIEVFENLEKAIYPLVIFGGYKYTGRSKKIITLDYLPEKEVELVLKHAFSLILPSYYEGFGLPVLEAFACGVPVVCSNVSALPEVAGDCALLFDPFSEEDILEKIRAIFSNDRLCQENIAKGLKRVQKFSWENSAKKLLEALQ